MANGAAFHFLASISLWHLYVAKKLTTQSKAVVYIYSKTCTNSHVSRTATRWHVFHLLHKRLTLSHATQIYVQGANQILSVRDVRLWTNRYAKLNYVKL